MDNRIKPCSDDSDFLSQSYNDGVERIVGLKKNNDFKVSKKVLKKRQQFWDDLCTTYSRPFTSDIEYNIATLQRCKSLSFVQYWINTGYLSYKTNPESDMSFIEEESLNSSLLDNVKEKTNRYSARLSYDESSLSSSIDTTAYILSNTNTTNKVETMAILKGAKHNALPNRKKSGNVEITQFQNAVLDNNGNAYKAALPTIPSKQKESLTQQRTNNFSKSITKPLTDPVNRDNILNCNSEHSEELFNAEVAGAFNASRYRNSDVREKCLNAMYVEKGSMVDESSTLEDNTTKLSSRKKLYSGRDSPVDLVDTTSRIKIVPINSRKNLHPALDPTSKTPRKYMRCRKRQRSHLSIFHTSKLNRSVMSISSYKKRKRRKIARSHVSENSSIMNFSKKRRIPVADKAENSPGKKKSFALSQSPKELLSTQSNLDNPVAQVEKPVNRVSVKSNRASRTDLNPRIYLRPVTERDIKKYRSSKKTTASPRGLCPVVRLIQLSGSDIKKYRKPNREATRPGSLNPPVHLKRLSEVNNPERRKSEEALDVRFKCPVIRLKKLSEQDIKKYKAETPRLENSDTAHVPDNSSTRLNISKPGSEAVHLIEDSDSDESTYLIYRCNSSVSQESQPSSSIVGVSKNRKNLVRKGTSNKYTGPDKSALCKTSETAQNGFCGKMIVDSSDSSRTVERRSLKNLKTSVSSLKKSESQPSSSNVEVSKNRKNLVRKGTSNKYTGPDKSVLCKTSETAQNGFCGKMIVDSSDSSRTVERRSLKNLKTSVSSLKKSESQPSSSNVEVSKNRKNLVRKGTSNKYTGPDKSALCKTSETAQNGFCGKMIVDSSDSSRTVERRSLKNLKTSVSSLKKSESQPSSSNVGVSKNRNLVRKDTSNKYTRPDKSALRKTSETAQNGFCGKMIVDSSVSSRTVERRSLKNLKTSVSSLKKSESQPSSSNVEVSKNRKNLVRKGTSNKYTRPDKSALRKTSETAQNGFCGKMIVDSSVSSRTVERRSLRKNLKTSVSNLKKSESVLPGKDVRQNDEAISCSDESEIFNKNAGTKRTSHNFILSDEDDEFVNLIYCSKKKTNSKIRSPYNSPRKSSKIRSPYNSPRKSSKIRSPYNSPRKNSKIRSPYNSPRKSSKIRSPYNSQQNNSDDSAETRNVGKCKTKSMGDQLLSKSNGRSTKFEKQTPYFYRKRKSKNLLYLSTEESISHATPLSIASSSLSRAYSYEPNKSQVVLRAKRKLLTSMNIKKDKSRLHTLRFQTRIFDSDSESSYFS